MAWIESHQSLVTHGKLLKLARQLGINKYEAIGHLQALWWWTIDNATDGSLAGHTPAIIAEAAGWYEHISWWQSYHTESPTQSQRITGLEFFLALVKSDFIDCPENGELISPNGEQKNQGFTDDTVLTPETRVHDWLEYCGDLVKKRLERQASDKAKSLVLQNSLKTRGKTGNKSPPTVPYRTVTNTPYSPPKQKVKKDTSLFDKFWSAYPKKRSKGEARKAFDKANHDEQQLATMLGAIERAKMSEDWRKEGGKYIPYPATWLNGEGWLDEYPTGERSGNGHDSDGGRQWKEVNARA